MAESKTSLNSKGGTNVLTKRVQREISRAQEKVLQKLGKSDETKDEMFERCVLKLQDQQNDAHRIYKDLKAYINAVRVMRDASNRLFQSLFDAYDPEWGGTEDLGTVVEGEDYVWGDYEVNLRDQALISMESYMSQFPDVRERVAKRGRKLVDYDSSRHHLTGLQNAKKKDDIKIGKAEDETKAAKMIFEDINREMKGELPLLFDSRIGCYVTVFQAISSLRENIYKKLVENNQDLQAVLKELKIQHPEKSFTVKTFSRSGSVKRRSFRDTLSPRSLKSFYDFHLNYSPRGTLRRQNSSSFRSEKPKHEPYSPKPTSPTRPQPPHENISGVRGTETFSIDFPKVEDASREAPVDDTSTTEDKPLESSTATNQDGQADHPEDLSSENESELQTNSSPTERTNNKSNTASDEAQEPEKEPGSSGMENGTDVRQPETSPKVDHSTEKKEVKTEVGPQTDDKGQHHSGH